MCYLLPSACYNNYCIALNFRRTQFSRFSTNFGKPRNLFTTKKFELLLTYSYYHVSVQSKTATTSSSSALSSPLPHDQNSDHEVAKDPRSWSRTGHQLRSEQSYSRSPDALVNMIAMDRVLAEVILGSAD